MRIAVAGARAGAFAPLDDGAVRSAAVVRRLGGAIALGLIGDGDQLPPEAELATSLRVAVVTLREALADLRRRGLVETRRGRGGGSFVRVSEPALTELSRQRSAELGSADLRELGEFHAALAGTAARLAAERASPHDLDRLRETIEAFAAANRPADRRRIDGRHHIEIAAAAQSVRLTAQELDVQTELAELQLFPPESPAWVADTLASHRSVLAAIAGRDGALARALTETRIAARTLEMVERHLALSAGHGAGGGPGSPGIVDEAAAVAPVGELVERVFRAVVRLRDRVLGPGGDHAPVSGVDVAGLRAGVATLLGENRDIVVGMGMIVAPGLPGHNRRRVLWWQDPGGRGAPAALQVDLNPQSLGFYDYGSADWFSVPRRSGDRHIDGPFVDAHGTDRYLLTFTVPVRAGSSFLGVVGADVPVSRFEAHLMRAWGAIDRPVVLVNAENRVVVSHSARIPVGDLLPPGISTRSVPLDLPGVPWRLELPG